MTVEDLQKLIEKGEAVLKTHKPNPPNMIGFTTLDNGSFAGWRTQTLSLFKGNLPKESVYITQFEVKVQNGYVSSVKAGIEIIKSLVEDINEGRILLSNPSSTLTVEETLINIFNKFHQVAKRLKKRYNNRETIIIKDEYDVQDLIHSLLLIHFEDIRPEEWTPQYAGKNSRIDFLLKDENIVVEIKKTRGNLTEKEIGDQLIIDIDRYKEHSSCEQLFCFVYDPDEIINNPRGLEKDLNRDSPIKVRVFIKP